jgi:hypothetical protein
MMMRRMMTMIGLFDQHVGQIRTFFHGTPRVGEESTSSRSLSDNWILIYFIVVCCKMADSDINSCELFWTRKGALHRMR